MARSIRPVVLMLLGIVPSLTLAQRLPPPTRYLVPPGMFELADEQRAEIGEIRREVHARYCELTGRLMDIQDELHRVYAKEQRIPKEVGQTFREMAALQQQLLEARIAAENAVDAVLTPEQRRELRQWRRGQPHPVFSADDFPYMMYPGTQQQDFEPWNIEEPERVPYPPGGGAMPGGGMRAPAR